MDPKTHNKINVTDALIQEWNLDTEIDMHTEQMPCEHEGSNHGNISSSERMSMIVAREVYHRLFLTIIRRNQHC